MQITLIHYIITICLMAYALCHSVKSDPYPMVQEYKFMRERISIIDKRYSKKHGAFIKSFIIGDKTDLPPKYIKQHKVLHLSHLMTPSGLHLGIIFFGLGPFIGFFRNQKSIFGLFICGAFQFLPGLYSIKRVAMLKILTLLLTKKVKDRLNIIFPLFISSMILNYLITKESISMTSFSLSYAFLGIFYFSKFETTIPTYFNIILMQIILFSMMEQSFYPLSIIFMGFIMFIFSFLFSFLLFDFLFLPYFNLSFISINLIDAYLIIIKYSSQMTQQFGLIVLSYTILPSILSIIARKKRLFFLSLFLYSENIYNLPLNYIHRKPVSKHFAGYPFDMIKTFSPTKKGYKVEYTNQQRCYFYILRFERDVKCLNIKPSKD